LHGSAEDPIFRFDPNLVKKCGGQKEFKIPDVSLCHLLILNMNSVIYFILKANDYNESQQKVILEASSIILHNEPKLCLIQGPPGTGKSHTIVGIVNSMFAVSLFPTLLCSI
jgi:hypothetical protein